jgi:hypothetical protein
VRVALKSSWLSGEAGGCPSPSASAGRGGLGAQDMVEIPTFHCIEWETDEVALLRAACSLMVRLYAMRGGVTDHTYAQTAWPSYQALTLLPRHPGASEKCFASASGKPTPRCSGSLGKATAHRRCAASQERECVCPWARARRGHREDPGEAQAAATARSLWTHPHTPSRISAK